MTLRANHPYRQLRAFVTLSYSEVFEILKEAEEPNISSVRDSFDNIVVTKLLVANVCVALSLPYDHEVDHFLTRVTVLIQKSTVF